MSESEKLFTTRLSEDEFRVLLALRALDERSRGTINYLIGLFAGNRGRALGTNVELLASRHFPRD